MNKITFALYTVLVSSFFAFEIQAQQTRQLNFNDVLRLASEQSPRAIMARHQFRSSYWEFRSFKAGYLPKLSLSATIPDLNRSFQKVSEREGEQFYKREQITSSGGLTLQQNIPFTGGSISINSDLERVDNLILDTIDYRSTIIDIVFRQPINGYNPMKWERLIQPLKFEEAKKIYLSAMENVSLRAVSYFFDLALAQKNVDIATQNFANADTLYKIAEGRYQLGTIAENELLQMQLSYLTANTQLNSARIDLNVKRYQLNSFLGLSQDINVELIIPTTIPDIEIELARALEEAKRNNPDVIGFKRQLYEADQRIAQARAQRGLNAELFAQVGLNQTAGDLSGAYLDPDELQRVRLGISIPLLDWGTGRGRYKMAQSSQELAQINIRQAEMDFEQEVLLQVMQFNLQDDQLRIAAKADTIGQNRYEVTKQRFLIGKISVLDLKDAIQEKDFATRSYVAAMKNYWTYFFNLRALTLFDWSNKQTLSEEFDTLIE